MAEMQTSPSPPAQQQQDVQEESAQTRILLAVSQSSIKGYPYPSISSNTAFDWLLAKLIHPACRRHFRLLILHVQVPDEDGFDDMDSMYATNDDFKDMRHKDKSRGVHLLQHFVKRCEDSELSCKAWLKRGDPKEIICHEASRVHPDILVVGSRGLKTLQRIFVATVSEYCSKHADCPVLVIRRNIKDAPDDPMDD